MYPFLAWQHQQLVDRLRRLLHEGFDIEAVVASVQTLEQGFKRPIVRQMNIRRLGFPDRRNLASPVSLRSTHERNRSVKHLGSLESIKTAWRALVSAEDESLALPALVDTVAGPGTWRTLSAKPIEGAITQAAEEQVGLFHLRHQLVHGWHLPPKGAIERLASTGVEMVALLLHPQTGIGQHIGYDPFCRMPRFRQQPAG